MRGTTGGLNDLSVKIIDKTDMRDPTKSEGLWACKLSSFIPRVLNVRDFLQFFLIFNETGRFWQFVNWNLDKRVCP